MHALFRVVFMVSVFYLCSQIVWYLFQNEMLLPWRRASWISGRVNEEPFSYSCVSTEASCLLSKQQKSNLLYFQLKQIPDLHIAGNESLLWCSKNRKKKVLLMKNWASPLVKVAMVAAGFMQHSSCHCWDGIEGNSKGANMSTCEQKTKKVGV